jgi:(p)ppGpp synthase/HD superfamily hydrolase
MLTPRDFAVAAHGDQEYGDLPYVDHLQEVAITLCRFGVRGPIILAAAWLHDVLEDTSVTPADLAFSFGPEVTALVVAVTNEPGANRKERAIRTYPKIRRFGKDAVVLKLADRIANTEHSIARQTPQLKMYRREFPEFSTALYASGEADAMWDHLRMISAEQRREEGKC